MILKTGFKFNDGYCLLMNFPQEHFIWAKQSPEQQQSLNSAVMIKYIVQHLYSAITTLSSMQYISLNIY